MSSQEQRICLQLINGSCLGCPHARDLVLEIHGRGYQKNIVIIRKLTNKFERRFCPPKVHIPIDTLFHPAQYGVHTNDL